ncbi:MAG TPA: Dabb family protein [Longimicrobiaceae bacterium]
MTKIATAVLSLALLAACAPAPAEDASAAQEESATDDAATQATTLQAPPAGSVRHIVVFRFREDATEEQIQQLTDAFRELKNKIPGIIAFEHGQNHSPEGKDQGFDHVYTITFESAAARDTYLPHPEHQAFGRLLGELGIHEDVFVVDYDPQP